MSIIEIINHDENITKIIDLSTIPHEQIIRTGHQTKLRSGLRAIRLEKATTKQHATMGLPQENPPDPCDFLKKQTGKLSYTQEAATVEKHMCEKKKKLFPTKEDITQYDAKKKEAENTVENFICKNIKTVLKMKPKEPIPRVVLEAHGETKPLSHGLEPTYIKTEDFGKTPSYLLSIIERREKQRQMEKDATGVEKPKCRYIRRDEREQLLEGLKHNWEELQKQYQGLPILTDTIPKINRKSKLEAELKQLEKDIVLVERHPYIYVYDESVVSFN